MKIYDITKLDLVINNESLKGKSAKQVEEYINQEIVPVLLTHILTQPKSGSASISCTGSSNGNVSCTGSVSINW